MELTVGSLFAGIGGFDLGFARAGFRTRWFCESNHFCWKVLNKNWPSVPIYSDIRALGGDANESPARVDVLCGGFP